MTVAASPIPLSTAPTQSLAPRPTGPAAPVQAVQPVADIGAESQGGFSGGGLSTPVVTGNASLGRVSEASAQGAGQENQPTRAGSQQEDQVTISEEGQAAQRQVQTPGDRSEPAPTASENRGGTTTAQTPQQNEESENPEELTESEMDLIRRLEARDAEVRAHEQAHLTAAGGLAKGPPKYDYQRGPDGQLYAIGGSVEIDVSPEPEPEQTIAKADRIRRAALAPAEPSSKDRAVAAQAATMKVDAQRELAAERAEEARVAQEEAQEVETPDIFGAQDQETQTNPFATAETEGAPPIGFGGGDSGNAERLGFFGDEQQNTSAFQGFSTSEGASRSGGEQVSTLANFRDNGLTYGLQNRNSGPIATTGLSVIG